MALKAPVTMRRYFVYGTLKLRASPLSKVPFKGVCYTDAPYTSALYIAFI